MTSSDCTSRTLQDLKKGPSLDTALGAGVRGSAHYGSCWFGSRRDEARYFDIHFVRCVELHAYTAKLFTTVSHRYKLSDDGRPGSGLYYICCAQLSGYVFFLKQSWHWTTETVIEEIQLTCGSWAAYFIEIHSKEYYATPSYSGYQFHENVPIGCGQYEVSRLLYLLRYLLFRNRSRWTLKTSHQKSNSLLQFSTALFSILWQLFCWCILMHCLACRRHL